MAVPIRVPGMNARETVKPQTVDSTNAGLQIKFERESASYEYGLILSGNTFFTGGAATKSRIFGLTATRPSGSAATGDSNDAGVFVSMSNYAANDTNFIWRGLNVTTTNRSGGTLGTIDNNIAASSKSGSTTPNLRALSVTAENYGTCATEFGGIDILLKNEGAAATTEYGLRIRNENNSIAGPVADAIRITETGANTGFTNVFYFTATAGCVATKTGTYTGSGNGCRLTIDIGGTTYYINGFTASS